MSKIHHATIKRAARLGVTIIEVEGGFVLNRTEDGLNSVDTFDSTAEALEALERDEVEFEDADEAEGSAKCGVMAKDYHDQYSRNPHGPGCGDTIDIEMRDAITVMDGKKSRVDEGVLCQIGIDAGLWKPSWESLNVGMRRMNLANRIRGLLRNNPEAQVRIGETTGRFGVVFQPAKSKARKAKVVA